MVKLPKDCLATLLFNLDSISLYFSFFYIWLTSFSNINTKFDFSLIKLSIVLCFACKCSDNAARFCESALIDNFGLISSCSLSSEWISFSFSSSSCNCLSLPSIDFFSNSANSKISVFYLLIIEICYLVLSLLSCLDNNIVRATVVI